MATKTQISFMIEGQNYGLDIMSVRAIEKCENILYQYNLFTVTGQT